MMDAHAAGRGVHSRFTGPAAGTLLAVITIAVLISALSWEFLDLQADETVLAWAGRQVSEGRIPYRDFFAFLPPFVLFGAGWIAEIAGPGLVALRVATLLFAAVTTAALHALLVERGTSPAWSALTASWFPALYFCVWPLSSHYWFALGFLASAAWVGSHSQTGPSRAFATGFLLALAGLCVQTAGVFVIILIACLFLFGWRPARETLVSGGLGLALPIVAFSILLLKHGALVDAFRHVIVWPLSTYAAAGGVNDVALFGVMNVPATWLSDTVPDGDVIAVLLMLLMWVTVLGGSAWLLYGRRRGTVARSFRSDTAIVLASLVAFFIGRRDWVHLAVWSVPVLFVLGSLAGSGSGSRVRVLARSVILLGVVFMAARFAVLWRTQPPSPSALLTADVRHREEFDRQLLSQLPGVIEHHLPVFYLSWAGSMLYLVWAPVAPPLDWLQPPSMRLNSSADLVAAVRFIEEQRIPYIVVAWRDHDAWLAEDSPIRTLLVNEFEFFTGTWMGAAYVRRGFRDAAPPFLPARSS